MKYSTSIEKNDNKTDLFLASFDLFLGVWPTFDLFLPFFSNIFGEFFSVFLILSRFIFNHGCRPLRDAKRYWRGTESSIRHTLRTGC